MRLPLVRMRPEVPVTALDGRAALSRVIRGGGDIYGGGDLGGLSWLAVGVGGGRALAVGGRWRWAVAVVGLASERRYCFCWRCGSWQRNLVGGVTRTTM